MSGPRVSMKMTGLFGCVLLAVACLLMIPFGITNKALATCPGISCLGTCEAAESGELFKTDINKQKAKMQKGINDAAVDISQNKIQSARSEISLVEYEYKQAKATMSQEDAAKFLDEIDKAKKYMAAREDSLVKSSIDILKAQGPDAALQYTKNQLSSFGVTQAKVDVIEKKILEDAPAVQQEKERDELSRALKALEAGQEPDVSIDPYIIRTAKRILQSRADSVKSVQDAKARKEMEEKERLQRVEMEKEQKEKKSEEQREAKVKVEEEKKRKVEEERQKKETARLDKIHKDSVEAAEKTQAAQAKVEESARKLKLAQEEKARKDSLEAAEKAQAAQAKVQEKARQDSAAAQAKQQAAQSKVQESARMQRLAQEEKARKDSVEAAEKNRAVQTTAQESLRKQQLAKEEKPRQDSLASLGKAQTAQTKAEENARKQRLAQEEKARKDSVEAAQKAQAAFAKAQEESRKQQLALEEKIRRDSLETLKKQRETQEKAEADRKRQQEALEKERAARATAAPVQPAPAQKQATQAVAIATPAPSAAATENAPSPSASKTAQEYLAGIRANQKKAQSEVMELYDIVDRKAAAQALEKFKAERKFIGENVDAQVFNTLEQAIMQLAVESQSKGGAQAAPAPSAQPESKDQEEIDRINGYVRDNKINAAYSEFKRVERQLKHYMPATDFKQLKSMVENAYKVRKQGG